MQNTIETLAREIGISMSAIHGWRRVGRVAYQHRLSLVSAAAEKGLALSEADFDSFKLVRTRHKVSPVRSTAEASERVLAKVTSSGPMSTAAA